MLCSNAAILYDRGAGIPNVCRPGARLTHAAVAATFCNWSFCLRRTSSRFIPEPPSFKPLIKAADTRGRLSPFSAERSGATLPISGQIARCEAHRQLHFGE